MYIRASLSNSIIFTEKSFPTLVHLLKDCHKNKVFFSISDLRVVPPPRDPKQSGGTPGQNKSPQHSIEKSAFWPEI